MKLLRLLAGLSASLALIACNPIRESAQTCTEPAPVTITPAGIGSGNTVPVQIGCGYLDEPCVSVQICEPGTSNCQIVNNILLDTGSYGLRVFKSTISSLTLTQETVSSSPIAEVTNYADGTCDWGPVETADVTLAGETASSIPIQVIDSTYAAVPASCSDPDISPDLSGFNGILGVGLWNQDCGSNCTVSGNEVYYTCSGSSCSSIGVPLTQQVANPVAALTTGDDQGVAVSLPSVGVNGASTVTGSMYLGIDSQADNTIGGSATVFSADSSANFQTIFDGVTYSDAFIDSGSNGLFFPEPTDLPACSDSSYASGFFCPSSDTPESATQKAASPGLTTESVSFDIISGDTAFSPCNSNMAWSNVGGGVAISMFDWGLPFFYGRTIFVGITGKTAGGNTGPYWAY